jgi:hypothetical protein
VVKLPQLPALEEVNDFDSAKRMIDLLVRYLKDLVAELEVNLNG